METRTLPRPVQAELPVWLTAAGNPETFQQAGEMGCNLLTHLLGQTLEEVAEKLKLYRAAWRRALLSLGPANTTTALWEDLCHPCTVNPGMHTTVVYSYSWADLHDGPRRRRAWLAAAIPPASPPITTSRSVIGGFYPAGPNLLGA